MLKELLDKKLQSVEPIKMSDLPASDKERQPSIFLTSDIIPELKDWDVGKEYVVVLKVQQTSKEVDKEERASGSFDITEAAALDPETNDDPESSQQSIRKKYA